MHLPGYLRRKALRIQSLSVTHRSRHIFLQGTTCACLGLALCHFRARSTWSSTHLKNGATRPQPLVMTGLPNRSGEGAAACRGKRESDLEESLINEA